MTFRQFALRNVWRSRSTYAAFFFSCVFSVFIFFIFMMFIFHPQLDEGYIRDDASNAMTVAAIVVLLFSSLFVLYSLGAFLNARKSEFGLLMLHGMRKRQLRSLIFTENVVIGAAAILVGVGVGLVFMKLFLLLGENVLGIDHLPFYTPWLAILITIGLYSVLFLSLSAFSTFLMRTTKLIDLLTGSRKPKPYPKKSVWLTLLALGLIAFGYYRSLTTHPNTIGDDILLVTPVIIIGTYFLFTQASVYIMDKLKEIRRSNWKQTRLIIASDLIFKLKDNARTFFLVTIVSTAAICAVGAIASLNTVADEQLEAQPFALSYSSGNPMGQVDQSYEDDEHREEHVQHLRDRLEAEHISYTKISIPGKVRTSATSGQLVTLIAEEHYNQAAQILDMDQEQLESNEAMLLPAHPDHLTNEEEHTGNTIRLDNEEKRWTVSNVLPQPLFPDVMMGSNLVIISDQSYAHIEAERKLLFEGFHVENWQAARGIGQEMNAQYFANVADKYAEQLSLYETMLFIALMVGVVFFVAAGSFLYFRMYTDLNADREKFAMLRKIGLKRAEVNRIVSVQTGILFFTPFVVAVIHAAVAFSALQTFFTLSITQDMLFVIAGFAVAQLCYYLLMKRQYMKQLLRNAT